MKYQLVIFIIFVCVTILFFILNKPKSKSKKVYDYNCNNNIIKNKNLLPINNYKHSNEPFDLPKTIWIMWNSEIYDAPKIVQKCINRIIKLHISWDINFITPSNYDKWVKDNTLLSYLKNKSFPPNYLSDALRFYLIYTYGGIYLDASIILLQSLDWVLDSQKLSIYKADKWSTNNKFPVFESWFISSPPSNEFASLCY